MPAIIKSRPKKPFQSGREPVSECRTCGRPKPPAGLVIDRDGRRLERWNGERRVAVSAAQLTGKEMDVLDALLRRAPGVMSDDRIITLVWSGDEPEYASNSIKVHITRLRRKIRPLGARIENVWGKGYRLVMEPDYGAGI